MQAKGLLILSGVTVVAVAAAALTLRSSAAGGTDEPDRSAVFPGLLDRVNDVARVEVVGGDDRVTLERTDAGWGLVERGGYVVDFSKVKELVMGVARLEIAEPKTSKPEYFERLGVQDPSAEGATSKLVSLYDASKNPLASLVIGKAGKGGRGVLVRPADGNQVYLCKESIRANADPKTWLDREILRLDNDRVQSVTIDHPDSPDVEISRDPENHTQFVVENVPEGRKPSFPGVANSVATSLSYLGLDDVRPLSEVQMGDTPLATTTVRCTDGLVLELQVSKQDGKTWVHVEASFDEPQVVGPSPAPQASDEEGAETEDDATEEDPHSPEKVRQEVADLNARLADWAFEIPQYKADVLAKPLEDLLEKLDQDKPAILDDSADLSDPEAAFDAAPDATATPPALQEEDAVPSTPPAELPTQEVQNPLEGLGDEPILPAEEPSAPESPPGG